MVVEKPPGREQVENLLRTTECNFARVDARIITKFDQELLKPICDFFTYVQEQKELAKDIIRDWSGQNRLPKTPKRGYHHLDEARIFTENRAALMNTIVHLTMNEPFENETSMSWEHQMHNPKTVEQYCTPTRKQPKTILQRTPRRPAAYRPWQLPSNFSAVSATSSKHTTAMSSAEKSFATCTKSRMNLRNQQISKTASSEQQPGVKRSEIIRKIEAKAINVIMNKEELMKEKSERARKEREERILRVKMNNKKKEVEQEERVKLMKLREQVEKQSQLRHMPERTVSKSPCRTRGYCNRIPIARTISSTDVSNTKIATPKVTKVPKQRAQTNAVRRGHPDILDSPQEKKRLKLSHICCDSSNELEDINDCSNSKCWSPELSTSPKHSLPKNHEEKLSALSVHTAIEPGMELKCKVKEKSVVQGEGSIENNLVEESSDEHKGNDRSEQIETAEENVNDENRDVLGDIKCPKQKVTNEGCEITKSEKKSSSGAYNNYNVDEISSADETDDEDNPRRAIPMWAQGENLSAALRKQKNDPQINLDLFFGPIRTPRLDEIFSRNRLRYHKRTSSAQWSSPLCEPKIGASRFFALQKK